MEANTDEIAKKCMDAINEKLKNLKKPNIIVVGKILGLEKKYTLSIVYFEIKIPGDRIGKTYNN